MCAHTAPSGASQLAQQQRTDRLLAQALVTRLSEGMLGAVLCSSLLRKDAIAAHRNTVSNDSSAWQFVTACFLSCCILCISNCATAAAASHVIANKP
jgi:hypothetical protein